MHKLFKFVLGMLFGAIIGSTVTLLLAPAPGAEVQDKIRTRFQELIEEGRKAAAERRAELERQLDAFKRGETSTGEVKIKLQ